MLNIINNNRLTKRYSNGGYEWSLKAKNMNWKSIKRIIGKLEDEHDEREKGCEWCKPDCSNCSRDCWHGKADTCGMYKPNDKFCSRCGKKLREDEDEDEEEEQYYYCYN